MERMTKQFIQMLIYPSELVLCRLQTKYFSYIIASVLLVEETGRPGETTELSQVNDQFDHIMLYRVPVLTGPLVNVSRKKLQVNI
jgi:hypothetical protein